MSPESNVLTYSGLHHGFGKEINKKKAIGNCDSRLISIDLARGLSQQSIQCGQTLWNNSDYEQSSYDSDCRWNLPKSANSNPIDITHRHGSSPSIPMTVVAGSSIDPYNNQFGSDHKSYKALRNCPLDGWIVNGTQPKLYVYANKRQKPDCFSRLPEELQLAILENLSHQTLVRCSRLCFDGNLWVDIDCLPFYRDIPHEQLSKIIYNAGSFVRRLNLRGCTQLRTRDLKVAANSCTHVEEIYLNGCRGIDHDGLASLISVNHKLRVLDLSGLSILKLKTCKLISTCCFDLQLLDLSWSFELDARSILTIVEGCSQLRIIRIDGDYETDNRTTSLLMEAISRLDTLYELSMEGWPLSDNHIEIFLGSPKYESSKAPALPDLTHLNIGRCSLLTDISFQAIARNMPLLSYLEISNVSQATDYGLIPAIASMPNLKKLDLHGCSRITDDLLKVLATQPCADTLSHIELSYCTGITDAGIATLFKTCYALRNLEVDNTRLGDETLLKATQFMCRRKRRQDFTSTQSLRIVIYDCRNITWASISEVMNCNARLVADDGEITPKQTSKKGIIRLKCPYDWQRVFDAHTRRVLRKELVAANMVRSQFTEKMMQAYETHGGRWDWTMLMGSMPLQFFPHDLMDDPTDEDRMPPGRRFRPCVVM